MVCLTLRVDKNKAAALAPLVFKAGLQFSFSDETQVLSFLKLGPDDDNAIPRFPFLAGFSSTRPKLDALNRNIIDHSKVVAPSGPVLTRMPR